MLLNSHYYKDCSLLKSFSGADCTLFYSHSKTSLFAQYYYVPVFAYDFNVLYYIQVHCVIRPKNDDGNLHFHPIIMIIIMIDK